MPSASSSRRRRNAEPESEIEEEPTQQMDIDQVDEEEDDEQPRRRTKQKVKAEKGKGAARKAAREAGSDQEDDAQASDGEEPFNEQTFLSNTTIDHHESQKLMGMAQDWASMESQLKTSAANLLTSIAISVADFDDDKAVEKDLTRLDLLMRELIDLNVEMQCHEKTLSNLHQRVMRGDEIKDVVELYEEDVKVKLESYQKKTTRQKYAKNESYASFKQGIYDVQHADTGMPPLVEFIPKEDGDVSDDDDDVEVGGVILDLRCPITLTTLDKPVTCTICKHSFSGAAIAQMLGPSKQTKKMCPAAGCNKMICLNDCMPDKDLERKVKAAQRRAARRAEDSVAEEIVE